VTTARVAPNFVVLLAPGANGRADHPTLMAIEAAVKPAPVRRVALPSRRAPERVAAEAADLVASTGVDQDRIILGGRSYGGRMGSEAVANGLSALGLVLISYPLHPPGQPESLRTDHFPRLRCPCLFVSGRGDAFASAEELGREADAIAGPVSIVWLDGGGHGLRHRDGEVAAVVAAWVKSLVEKPDPPLSGNH